MSVLSRIWFRTLLARPLSAARRAARRVGDRVVPKLAVLALIPLMAMGDGQIGPACGSVPSEAAPGNSVRLLTFNTALYSPIFQCGLPVVFNSCYLLSPLGDYIHERAVQIAERLEVSDFDVIALNEVWDEDDGKDVLWSVLCESYPNYLKYVDWSGAGVEEDAGLMLFSRFGFKPLADDTFVAEDSESSDGDDSELIGFTDFDDCASFDCWASKGAALLRLVHPSSGRTINVVTTHLQADYGDDPPNDGVRWDQMRQVRGQCETGLPALDPNLITSTTGHAPCQWANDEWLVIAGDLNIDGKGAVGANLFPADAPCDIVTCPNEWWAQIGGPASPPNAQGYALYDPWAETTAETDIGSSAHDERLDHILVSRRTSAPAPLATAPPDLCVQHVWIPPELEGFSDHPPVAADLNLHAPQCNPRLAFTPTPGQMGGLGMVEGKDAVKQHRTIEQPGGMQWWRFSQPGTYSISLGPDAEADSLAFDVYSYDNLSKPLAGSYNKGADTILACEAPTSRREPPSCEETEAVKFVLPEAAYVRVYSTDRTWTGDYWAAFHRYDCKSADEACELLPNAPSRFTFPPAGTPLNSEDAAFFRLRIEEQADSGQPQKLSFFAENRGGAGWKEPRLELLDATATTVVGDVGGTPLTGPTAATAPSGSQLVSLDGQTTNDDEYVLRIGRADVTTDLDIDVGWRTNLVLLGGSTIGDEPAKLVCHDETNPESGADEITLNVNPDGTGWQPRGAASFDCDEQSHPRQWDNELGVLRLLEGAQIRPSEGDDTSDDDLAPIAAPTLPAFNDNVTGPATHQLFWNWDGGDYRLHFNVSKWRTG